MKQPENTSLALPVVCTRGIVFFPHIEMALEVGRDKSMNAISYSQEKSDSFLIILSQKDSEVFDPVQSDLYDVGTLVKIKNIKSNSDGSKRVLFEGLLRLKITKLIISEEYYLANYEIIDDIYGDKNEEIALVRSLAKTIEELANTPSTQFPVNLIQEMSKGISAHELADSIAHYLPISLESKQKVLETREVNERLKLIIEAISQEKEINKLESEINQKVRDRIDENQKEYVLREKLRAIKEELGDTPNKDDDTDEIRKQIEENPYPDNIKNKILDELRRYDMMPPSSAESSVIRTYIDWVLKTPWYQRSDDNDDLNNVEKVLNDDHYGLEKIKERILEYLAVKKLTSSLKAPILCFSGPPGTGKTSLAISIAKALGRKFVKVSLGGVRDEAEIRGHRRTYLGSMPGRIIQGMKKAGVINPVFLLDEIDKVGADYKGDPSNALLEVLDPEQNMAFSDNYLEEPYDLSNVLFIATANYLENIPSPLRDRLEIIELSSYTEVEKLNIAQNHLVKKQILENGLQVNKISFTNDSILHIIRFYTREAGVRNLERNIGAICRKIAVKVVKNGVKTKQIVNIKKVKEYLGKEKFDYTKKEKKNQIGVTTGLAYTQYGGDILPVEVVVFEGKGRINITGNLGDVMKESASIALGYVKSQAKKYKIDPAIFEKIDIHIHCPEGAVPKDGPSAGVTIATSLISALTNYPVRLDIAMTGEITLRGNVLPIGGLKEKSIGAHRSGITTIFIPKDNEKDIEEIPESIRKDMKIISVDNVEKIIDQVLVKGKAN
ncbi:MAG: endopeptidase La [Bacilli bacterium]|nr:endopeptidase La [Bacilli bacterium]MDD4584279.1 endopeptidase La [Bacilli bacterium]